MDRHAANEMTNSHLLVHNFDYLEASTIDEALYWLEQYDGRARLLAGGTDLIVLLKMERLSPAAIINITKIPGLNEIKVNPNGSVDIGPLVTIHTLAMHPYICLLYTSICQVHLIRAKPKQAVEAGHSTSIWSLV